MLKKILLSGIIALIGFEYTIGQEFTKTENGYVPSSPVELGEDDGNKLANLIEALEEQDDVQDVFQYVAQHRLEDALTDGNVDICADIMNSVSVL